jgi:superfamily II DNA or RNA helicase
MILVDEAHSCAKPAGANHSQQLRHDLLHELSKRKDKHLILLTATPHSGKQEEFQSLLEFLKPEFGRLDITQANENERKDVAKYFVQRRRGDILKWLDEETKFPVRNSEELAYKVGAAYADLFNDILAYARDTVAGSSHDKRKQRYTYWDVLALLRGVMSSPVAGTVMLKAKAEKKRLPGDDDESDLGDPDQENEDIMDANHESDDNLALSAIGKSGTIVESEARRLQGFARRMELLCGLEHDQKANEALFQIKKWVDYGYNPIIFCRYIQTANYLGTIFKQSLTGRAYKSLHIEVVTSEMNDELRKDKIDEMNRSQRRLLIATDCLSEGINLQQGFNAILHYDLPWNPNRLEQREGRIDRFGQQSPEVEVALLYGSNNPIDGVVLEVLIRKAVAIRKSTGITVPFPENSSTVMQAVMNAVLLKPTVNVRQVDEQLSLFEAEEIEAEKKKVASSMDEAADREKVSRSIFAQNTIKANEIEEDLKSMDNAIGDVKTVETFVTEGLRFLGVQVEPMKNGYKIFTINIPQRLREFLTVKNEVLVSFRSPTPEGYLYLGRNHPFTENLSQTIINNSLNQTGKIAARASVVRTAAVHETTVLVQFRVRNVIAEQSYNKEIVAEEMWLWGYYGNISEKREIDHEEALKLLLQSTPTQNVETGEQQYWLEEEMRWVHDPLLFRQTTDPIALKRAKNLVDSHVRVRKLLKGSLFKVVEPVLPMDVMGVYILLPVIQ